MKRFYKKCNDWFYIQKIENLSYADKTLFLETKFKNSVRENNTKEFIDVENSSCFPVTLWIDALEHSSERNYHGITKHIVTHMGMPKYPERCGKMIYKEPQTIS